MKVLMGNILAFNSEALCSQRIWSWTRWLTFSDWTHLYVVERGVKVLSHFSSLCLFQSSPLLNILFAPDGCEGGAGLTDPRGPAGLNSPCSVAKSPAFSPELGRVVTARCKTLQPFSPESHADSLDVPAEQRPDWGKIKYESYSTVALPPRGPHGENLDCLPEHIFWTAVIHRYVGSCQFSLRDTSEAGSFCQDKSNPFKSQSGMTTACLVVFIFSFLRRTRLIFVL